MTARHASLWVMLASTATAVFGGAGLTTAYLLALGGYAWLYLSAHPVD